MRTWRLLLIGFGTVGQGLAARLGAAADELAAAGCEPLVVGVVDPVLGSVASDAGLDPERLLELVVAGESLTGYPGGRPLEDGLAAIESVEADVVMEMTPTDLRTGGVGLLHVRRALQQGRHVCTTNKGPVALAWAELRDLAATHGVQLRCEGTVLSGTPLLSLFECGLRGAGLRGVRGILNGTCNFILSEMEAGASYDEALARAQELGYAETDPTGDIEGWDAAAKVAILGNLLFGLELTLEDVRRRGITDLSAHAVSSARAKGHCWRLVGHLQRPEGRWDAADAPLLLEDSDPLAGVTGPGNMLLFDTEALGEVAIAGPGAGGPATGHALISDLLAIHRTRS